MRSGLINSVKNLLFAFLLLFAGCKEENKEILFSVAFMTDIHLQPERNAVEGFTMALEAANDLKPDFIMTGGDLVVDALAADYERASSLFDLYNQVITTAAVPVYNTMGNHDIFGIEGSGSADPSDPEYGEKMYTQRIGESFYAFTHQGWKFMVLNSAEDNGEGSYKGFIDPQQIDWIKQELMGTDRATPLVITTHIPFRSTLASIYLDYGGVDQASRFVTNAEEVLELFSGYNLKLVLQGHHHFVEDDLADGIHFITGGAVSGSSWWGPYLIFEEGFLYLTFTRDDFSWKYVDYGWEAVK